MRSCFGHDKGRYYLVVNFEHNMAKIADGKRRMIEHPKKKNPKHLAPTQVVVNTDDYPTNRKIRNLLWQYNYPEYSASQ